jgi:hypothetical protein
LCPAFIEDLVIEILAVRRIDQAVLLRPRPAPRSFGAMVAGPAGAAGIVALLRVNWDGLDADGFVALVFVAVLAFVVPPPFVYARLNRTRLLLLQIVPGWRKLGHIEVERILELMDARDAAVDAAERLGAPNDLSRLVQCSSSERAHVILVGRIHCGLR